MSNCDRKTCKLSGDTIPEAVTAQTEPIRTDKCCEYGHFGTDHECHHQCVIPADAAQTEPGPRTDECAHEFMPPLLDGSTSCIRCDKPFAQPQERTGRLSAQAFWKQWDTSRDARGNYSVDYWLQLMEAFRDASEVQELAASERMLKLWKRSMCVLYKMLDDAECPHPESAIGLTTSALDRKLAELAALRKEMEHVKKDRQAPLDSEFDLRRYVAELRQREPAEGER